MTDQQEGLVQGAEVVITNVDTNVSSRQATNTDGLYVFSSLKPGKYRINVTKGGFQAINLTDVVLNVQDSISQNFKLQVGSVSESITVVAGAININTADASVSTVVDQAYIKNMPLNGRSFQDLILLTPGTVTQTPQASLSSFSGLGRTGEFSINGQRTESNYYTVDGASANVGAAPGFTMSSGAGVSGSVAAATALGTTQALVSVDDLQEFRVQSSTYSAEYGRNPGGQFSLETKSGSNQVRGTASDYLRNGFFDAQDWFNDYFGVKQAALRQNDFGGTLGSPVRIPGLYNGIDKTFFFVSYEGLRLTAPQAASVNIVPDLCMRGVVAQCPAGRQPAASPLQSVINAFPVPSSNGLEDATNGLGQFIGSWSNPSSLDSTSVRFDHVINDKLRLFFRFSGTGSSSATRGTPSAGSTPTLEHISTYTFRSYTAGASSLLTNRLSNELRINYSSNKATQSQVIEAFGGGIPVNLAELSGVGVGSEVLFCICIRGFYPLDPLQQSGTQRQWNIVDTVSFSLGRHQVKFGLDYRRLTPFAIPPTPAFVYLYLDEPSVETNSPFAEAGTQAPLYPLYKNFSGFAQDEWRVSQRLNLSVGLRWEVNPAPGVTRGLKPYTLQGASLDTLTLAPQGTPLWQTTWYNLAPRLGVAYFLRDTPGQETVVRGGGGVFFDTGQQLGSLGFNGVGFIATVFPSGGFPLPAAQVPPIVNPPVAPYAGFSVFGFGPHLQLPYTLQWNASIEQALGKAQALTFSYVGSHAARLLQQSFLSPSNNPNISGQFAFVENGLTSDYDSLQVQFRRKLSRGLTALASYTWSHCIDYGSQNLAFGYQRGNCGFDVRHNVSAAFSYDVPNIRSNGLLNGVLQHWGLDGRFTMRSAFPVTLNGNQLLQPNGKIYDAGLSFVPGQPVYLYGDNCATVLQGLGDLAQGKGCPGGRAINPQAFTNVSSGFGNAPRNFARLFGAWQMDLAVRREFPIYERLRLQFRAEAFNIFNHPNFGSIDPNLFSSTFGQTTGTLASSLGVLSPLYQTGGSRSMQFALKIIF